MALSSRHEMKNWLFKLLFPRQYEHMGELVEDVIRLEREKQGKTKSDTDTETQWFDKKWVVRKPGKKS